MDGKFRPLGTGCTIHSVTHYCQSTACTRRHPNMKPCRHGSLDTEVYRLAAPDTCRLCGAQASLGQAASIQAHQEQISSFPNSRRSNLRTRQLNCSYWRIVTTLCSCATQCRTSYTLNFLSIGWSGRCPKLSVGRRACTMWHNLASLPSPNPKLESVFGHGERGNAQIG